MPGRVTSTVRCRPTSVSLLGQPAPDFSDPLGMLAACHGRMLGFCDLLDRLPAWIGEHGIDEEVHTGCQRVIRYFSTAARLHHQDEEDDLFPLLVGNADMVELITRLRAEHQTLESAWQALERQLDGVLEARHDPQALATTIGQFCTAYRAHIDIENRHLLPKARTLLGTDRLTRLGESMAARRRTDGDLGHR